MEYIDLSKYFHNVTEALSNYRALTAFCESAVDQVIWTINGIDIPTRLMCNAERVLTTADIKAHIDNELEVYEGVCELRGEERKFNIIRCKFIDMPGSKHKKGVFSNESLAGVFDCSVDTIKRELKEAKKELKIYFFGVDKV